MGIGAFFAVASRQHPFTCEKTGCGRMATGWCSHARAWVYPLACRCVRRDCTGVRRTLARSHSNTRASPRMRTYLREPAHTRQYIPAREREVLLSERDALSESHARVREESPMHLLQEYLENAHGHKGVLRYARALFQTFRFGVNLTTIAVLSEGVSCCNRIVLYSKQYYSTHERPRACRCVQSPVY